MKKPFLWFLAFVFFTICAGICSDLGLTGISLALVCVSLVIVSWLLLSYLDGKLSFDSKTRSERDRY